MHYIQTHYRTSASKSYQTPHVSPPTPTPPPDQHFLNAGNSTNPLSYSLEIGAYMNDPH